MVIQCQCTGYRIEQDTPIITNEDCSSAAKVQSIQSDRSFACIKYLPPESHLPLNRPLMRLELPPLPKPNAFRRSTSILPHILFWKRRRVAEKTIVEDWIAWKLTNESSICDRHEFALLQPQREFLGDECFGGKYVLVYLPFPHVHIAQLNAAGCECHFDVDLGEISWLPGMQPRSRSVNFLGQRIWLVRFPVEMGGDEQAELTASDQLGTSAKTGIV